MNKARAVVPSEKAPDEPKGPTQEEVLIEIRDLLKGRAEPVAPPPWHPRDLIRRALSAQRSARPFRRAQPTGSDAPLGVGDEGEVEEALDLGRVPEVGLAVDSPESSAITKRSSLRGVGGQS